MKLAGIPNNAAYHWMWEYEMSVGLRKDVREERRKAENERRKAEYPANRQKIRSRARARYAANPEAVLARHRKPAREYARKVRAKAKQVDRLIEELAQAKTDLAKLEAAKEKIETAERILANIKREPDPASSLRLRLAAILEEEGFKGKGLASLVYPEVKNRDLADGRLRKLRNRNKETYRSEQERVRTMSRDEREEWKRETASQLRAALA